VIHSIVVPVRGDGKGDNVFAHAAILAARFNAHIKVAHCRPRAEDMMPYGVAIPAQLRKLVLSQSADVADQVEKGMRGELEALAKKLGITISEKALIGKPSASWVEEQGRQVDVIKRHGRIADLICVAKPDVDRNLGANTLKAALFNTGRPVMMCPPVQPANNVLCDSVAIGWLRRHQRLRFFLRGPKSTGRSQRVWHPTLRLVVSQPLCRGSKQSAK